VTIRLLVPTDIPVLEARAAVSVFPYPSPYEAETVLVVIDVEGRIVTACAAKRLVELYLWPIEGSPVGAMEALKLLHCEMAKRLRALGYTEANAQLPPAIAAKFSRRLRRSFGWMQNTWENWFIRF
jgi:hypothetical protein